MKRALVLSLLASLSALPALADETKGLPYAGPTLRIPSPGAEWRMQSHIPSAPRLLGAFVLTRGETKGSIISFGIEEMPIPSDPSRYARESFKTLAAEPLGMRVKKHGAWQWRGSDAYRVEYTDRDGIRHFAQAVLRTPEGGLLVVNLQSPDRESYEQDLPAFRKMLDGIQLPRPSRSGAISRL